MSVEENSNGTLTCIEGDNQLEVNPTITPKSQPEPFASDEHQNMPPTTLPENVPDAILAIADLPDIEQDLEPEDVVRILFLTAHDWPAAVLHKCVMKMQSWNCGTAAADSFSSWARSFEDGMWKRLFLEALAVIGRLDVLANLGLDQEQIKRLQKPVYLSSLKVVLHTICCQLKQEDVGRLCESISNQNPDAVSPVFPEGRVIKQLLELHILHWMQERIIDPTDLTVLADGLFNIGRADLRAELLRELSAPMATGKVTPDHGKVVDMTASAGASKDMSTLKTYPNSRGFCMIFNQEEFKCKEKYCVLKKQANHGQRKGSQFDADRLLATFQKFGCKTKIFHDRNRRRIKKKLRSVSKDNDLKSFDFLVLCFLSHGSRDIHGHYILSSDCLPLWMDDLFHYFGADCCGALAGKLKIVITQACQGPYALRPVVVADGLGGSETAGVQQKRNQSYTTARADFLFLSATTPGYVAFRNEGYGSSYIKELCDVLEQRGHLQEISCCMKDVHNRIAGCRIPFTGPDNVRREYAMQPQVTDTTTGSFKFRRVPWVPARCAP